MTKSAPLTWYTVLFSALLLAVTLVGLLLNPIGKAEAHPEGWTTFPVCVEYKQIDPNPPFCVRWGNGPGYYVPPHDH